jgi:cell division protein FtsW
MLAAIRYFENFNNYSPKQRVLYISGLVYPLAIFVLQPDFGTFFIAAMIIGFIAFLSSFPRKYFYATLVMGFIGASGILVSAPYRVKRLLTFLDPWKDPRGSGFQVIQSFLAFANGAFFGQGLGNSNEKLFYLPEAYNDFIFSVVGEELGFIGVIATAIMFVSFIFIGFKMAISLKSRVGGIMVSTIIFSIGFQAFLNMGVVLGVLPTKGLNLPFISYGGSSMVANLSALGLIFACIKIQPSDAKEIKNKGKQSPVGALKSAFN